MEPVAPISDLIRRAVELSFAPEHRDPVVELLAPVWQWNSEYLRGAILALAFGDKTRVEELSSAAQRDARDILQLLEFPPPGLSRSELAVRYRQLGLPVPAVLVGTDVRGGSVGHHT